MINRLSFLNNNYTSAEYRRLADKIIRKYQHIKFRSTNVNSIKKCLGEYLPINNKNVNIKDLTKKDQIFINLIERALETLNEKDREIIKDFFINHKNASDKFYSKPWFYRLLNEASKNFCELILW
ncbi:MG284/MPN403 family protein [Mycoplasmoides alvi]|uniref:MG284/MPN403 family protein n=1 Tax=Mycoplasmoides alvi TaxID=78580 RepID=UPI00051B1005|nr:hypothetical protein [Mycoplasmoides alvi]